MNIGRFMNVRYIECEEEFNRFYLTEELAMSFDGTTDCALQAAIDVQCDEICETMGVDELAWVECSVKVKRHCGSNMAYVVLSVLVDDACRHVHRVVPVELTDEEVAGIAALNVRSYADDLRKVWNIEYIE